jgi:hypothetical protein
MRNIDRSQSMDRNLERQDGAKKPLDRYIMLNYYHEMLLAPSLESTLPLRSKEVHLSSWQEGE